MPAAGSKSSGRNELRPPGASFSARANISRTTSESQDFNNNSRLASGGVGAALMILMNSSILARATAKPSST